MTSNRKKVSKIKYHSVAELKAASLLPAALANNWSARELGRQANVSPVVAGRVLQEQATRYRASISSDADKRVEVARNARNKALARLPELESLLDRAKETLINALPKQDGTPGTPVALDKFGEPIPIDPQGIIKAMGGLVKAGKDLHSYMEQATGLDVVKAVAVRQQTQGSGPVTSWDGVGSLEASIETEVEMLPIETQEDWI